MKGDLIMDISAAYMIESKDLVRATPSSIIESYTMFDSELGTDFVQEFTKTVLEKTSKTTLGNFEDEYPFENFMIDAVEALVKSTEGTDQEDAEDQITWLNDEFTNLYDLINKVLSGTSKFYIVDTDLCDPVECVQE